MRQWNFLKEMNNILITSAGQRVSLVRAFQNEIKSYSKEAKVLTVDCMPELSPACQISDGFFKVPRINDSNYIEELLQICEINEVKLLIPTIDTELILLAEQQSLFNSKGINIVISRLDFVRICRDKRLTNTFFEENGIAIPKAIDRYNPTFPLFIKPYNGSLSRDIHIIESASELTENLVNNKELLFMEYISPKVFDEFTLDAYFDKKHNLKCVVPRKRITVRAGEINKGVTAKNEIVDFIVEKLKYIDGARGCLTIQVFFNSQSKEIIGIEINPRFGGGYPLSYLAGANYPKWLIQEYLLGEEVPFFKNWKDKLLMLRYDAEVLVENYE